ncbi:collagen binding domain-containing protein [Fructobacillus parabroussonetiae]|uniref:collagen binding domain-containing protein n=1 Tax=Fructobacillus parabroussonetiae TaxID=2713174 RepID=UPI0024A785BA|nr:collagen binding domain-containing protein [Fructobacillus parabroussonetiae]
MFKRFTIILSILFLSGVSNLQGFADETPVENPYVKSVHLDDLSQSASAKAYNVDDLMKITWPFDIAKGSPIKAGEQLKFYLPINFTFDKNIMDTVNKVNALTDADGNRLGTNSLEGDHYIAITWNDYAENYFKHGGLNDNQLIAYAGWNVEKSSHSVQVPINWGVKTNDVPATPTVTPSTNTNPTPATPSGKDDFIINKSGNYGNSTDEAGYIYWSVRINAAKLTINDAVLTDTLGQGQTLAGTKNFEVWKYDLTNGWDMNKRTFISSGDYGDHGISVDPGLEQSGTKKFSVRFGNIDSNTGYEIFYMSKYDPDNTPDGTQFTNSADLTGTNFKTATANDVHTKDIVFIYDFVMGKERPGSHKPTPEPDPNPAPAPEPTPAPTPAPKPTPEPTLTPAPVPKPTPTPAPAPKPAPTPAPNSVPETKPTPAPSPQHKAAAQSTIND